MNISDRLGSIFNNHLDADLLAKFLASVDGLWMYSETQQPYDVFLWEAAEHGELSRDPYLFKFMQVVEKLHGTKIPICKTSLLQEKHRFKMPNIVLQSASVKKLQLICVAH